MKRLSFFLAATALLLAACSETSPPESAAPESATPESGDKPTAAADGVEMLFNGTDLDGWIGDPDNWKVENGVIVGTTTAEDPLPYNQFLIWDGEPVEDFILTADLKLTSDGNNSGIQYRSELRPDLGEFVVSGYQCDVHPAVWALGMIYDEKGRGILCKRGMKAVVTPEGKAKQVGDLPMEPEFDPSQWNTYRVIAKGNHLIHEVNGTITTELHDHHEAERELAGVIAFQIHRGAPMKVEIRNVKLERLPTSKPISADATPVPADAPDVNPPRNPGAGKGKGKAKAKDGEKAKAPAAPKAAPKATPKAPEKAAPKTESGQ